MSTTNIKINSLRTEYDFLRPCTDTSLISLDNSTLSSQLNNQVTLEGALDYLSRIYAHWWKRELKVPVYGTQEIQGTSTPILQKQYWQTWQSSFTSSLSFQSSDSIVENRAAINLVSPSVINYSVSWTQAGDEFTTNSSYPASSKKYVKYNNVIYYDKIGISIFYNGNSDSRYIEYYVRATAYNYPSTLSRTISSYETTTDYIFSFNRNAYPDSRTSRQYTYTYLGVPFENARGN